MIRLWMCVSREISDEKRNNKSNAKFTQESNNVIGLHGEKETIAKESIYLLKLAQPFHYEAHSKKLTYVGFTYSKENRTMESHKQQVREMG